MLSWYVLTSSAFKTAVEANKVTSDMMIFTSDTHEIYRGTQAYTESTVLFTGTNGAHPTQTAAVGKLYINSATLEGWVYNGTSWTQVIKAVATTVNASNTTQAVSGKAVADYVATEVGKAQSNVTELEKTVAANKTAAEQAVAAEATARGEAIAAVQEDVDANADAIALINKNLGSYATDAEVGDIRTALEALISAKMAKVGTGKTGEVIVADANGDASASGKKIGGSTFGSNQTDTLATEAGVVAYVGANAVAKTAVVTTLDADAPSDAEVPSESAVVAALTWKTSI